MPAILRFAESEADHDAIYRLRYEIYVEEMGYAFPGVDHQGRRLVEPFTLPTRLLMAEEDGSLVGTLQFNWGAESAFTDEERRIYRLSDFVALVGDEEIMIASRFMTRPSHRDSDLPARMLDAMFEFALDNNVPLLFADCRPHLINNYLRLGFRTFAKTYNDPIAGMLAPLIFVIDDLAHLERIKSRLLPLFRAKRPAGPDAIVSKVLALLPASTPVQLLSNPAGSPDWTGLQTTLAEDEISIFHGMEPEDVARLIEMSPVINCASGDRIVGQDLAERSVFVVLDGAVEVMRDGKSIALLTRSAVFGEIAFLLGIERTADVVAVGETKVISLRERALNELIASESKLAARFLLNLARVACLKLVETDRAGH
ncbi:cyclic nucleotide-binding domain-containing protein [Dongia deserti]|uniref:cyclic nucleotide-binding domain-containing protein n=1 Tax=Dongia deserti TaxID=2268030 RepID=UPI000E653F24|nr:cyclic nucleotide-binding domain-containing protein [Dongia deserti]